MDGERPRVFTNEAFRQVVSRLFSALERAAEEVGVSVCLAGKSHGDYKGEVILHLGILDAFGQPERPIVTDFKLYAELLGLKKGDLGRTFTHRGKTYRLKGYNPANKARPFVLVDLEKGRRVYMGEALVVGALTQSEATQSLQ